MLARKLPRRSKAKKKGSSPGVLSPGLQVFFRERSLINRTTTAYSAASGAPCRSARVSEYCTCVSVSVCVCARVCTKGKRKARESVFHYTFSISIRRWRRELNETRTNEGTGKKVQQRERVRPTTPFCQSHLSVCVCVCVHVGKEKIVLCSYRMLLESHHHQG